MLYLFMAIGCSVSIAIMMKVRRNIVHNEYAMFMANYLVCIILSFYFSGRIVINNESSFSIILGILSGFLYLYSFVISDRNVHKNGMVMSSTFGKLGVLVPTAMSFLLFKETLIFRQVIGFALAIIAIILIYFEKESLSSVTSKGFLIFYMLIAGITDSSIALYDHYGSALYKNQFLLINFIFAFIFSIFFLIKRREKFSYQDLLFGLILGIPNYFSSRFMLQALESVPAIIAYPISSICGMLFISLIGALVFKEHLSQKKIIALGIIIFAVVMLNL